MKVVPSQIESERQQKIGVLSNTWNFVEVNLPCILLFIKTPAPTNQITARRKKPGS